VHLRRARDLVTATTRSPSMSRPWRVPRSCRPRTSRASPVRRYGETPYSYLMTRRIERAKTLLRQGKSVSDTCVAVGCTSLGSFSLALHRDRRRDAVAVPRGATTATSRSFRRAVVCLRRDRGVTPVAS